MSSPPQIPSSSSQFGSILESALSEYKKQTGKDLLDNWLTKELQDCDSVDAVLDIIQHQAEALDKFGDGDKKLMKWIGSSVQILYVISATLGEGVGVSLSPAKAVFAGIAVLLAATKDSRASHDVLVHLFQHIEFFLKRLGVETLISPTKDMIEIYMKIVAEVLSILSTATKEMQQNRRHQIRSFLKKLAGREDIQVEDALKRLGSLTEELRRMASAQVLESSTRITSVEDRVRRVEETDIQITKVLFDVRKTEWIQIERDVRGWLFPPDPSTNYNIACDIHHEGTATWIFESSVFKEWELNGSLLWIHGKPGSGKSVICSVIINHVMLLRDAGLASLAYFYFDSRDLDKQHTRNMVTSLLIQLAARSERCCDIIFRLYSSHENGSHQPGVGTLTSCLREMLLDTAQQPVYIIMDALDECPNMSGMPTPRETVLRLLKDLVGMHVPNLHICVTSRSEIDIKTALAPLTFCAISLHDEIGQRKDISDYVSNIVYSGGRRDMMMRWRDDDKKLVVEDISEKADGMFRWVFCQLEALRHCLPSSIRRVLRELPESLDETYERILMQIPRASRGQAYRMLQCLVVAVRPLRVEELAEVLAFDFDPSRGLVPRYRPEWRFDDEEQAVLSTCSSLVTIVGDHDSHVVQFSHFSVKEFLTSSRLASLTSDTSIYPITPSDAHATLAQVCLGSLLYFGDRVDDESVKYHPLARYAAEYWVTHAQFEDVASRVKDGMESLFDPDKPHFAAWVGIYNIDEPYHAYREFSKVPTPLYYSSLCGFRDLVEWLAIKCPQDANAIGGRYEFPLLAALVGKHDRVVKTLLDLGANANIQGTRGRTPLHNMIGNSDLDSVRLLLEYGADADAQQDDLSTPLHLAVRNGYPTGAQLHWSALEGRLEIVKILLDHGANANAENNQGETPLHLVLRSGHDSQALSVDIAKLLLEHGADAHARDKNYATPWLLARYRGRLDIARVLLYHDAKAPTEND